MTIEKEIRVVEQEWLDCMKVSPQYITFRCDQCGKVWGVNVDCNENQKLKIHDLTCRDCSMKILDH
jgi:DNA-directed RNA polymerase subunit RPC12/RpoP